ncbi:MAG: alternative ribosome rescue aminoacyl-tRNA hydrolase ArfB [Planctomycetia bacterium]|nr:alternative ribosome rescue aminoacyl-tRNA hydrolase ArfB [Planctomycetia bacterium]
MPEPEFYHLEIPESEISFTFVRSSGPGGQNVNKVASKAVLSWNPATSVLLAGRPEVVERLQTLYPSAFNKKGEILLKSQLTRDAIRNREDCLEKLRAMLLRAFRKPKRRIRTKPTRGSNERRLRKKSQNAEKKASRNFRQEF